MKISLKLSGLKRCLGIGAVLVMCLSTARATMQLTMMRPEFGPLYAARFHVHPEEIIKAKNGLNSQVGDMARSIHKITGYEVKFYKVEPNYQEIGSFPMFDTDQKDAYALYLPSGRIPFGEGVYRHRLLAIFDDGSNAELGIVDHTLRRILLKGVSPLRLEWDVN